MKNNFNFGDKIVRMEDVSGDLPVGTICQVIGQPNSYFIDVINLTNGLTYMRYSPENFKLVEENIIIKESKNIMSKALDFVKELTLSSDEKLLRKWGLKDDEGNYTHDSEKIVILKLVEDNKAHLLSIAQGLEDKEKASK